MAVHRMSFDSDGATTANAVATEYYKVRKKRYAIKAEIRSRNAMPKTVENFLEKSSYTTDSNKRIILTGTAGEQWTIDDAKFCKTYTIKGKRMTPEVLNALIAKVEAAGKAACSVVVETSPDSGFVWARHLPVPNQMQVNTSWGEVLTANDPTVDHGAGDWIIAADANGSPDENDKWVVNGIIFPQTYEQVN